jgi:hypothetical protein
LILLKQARCVPDEQFVAARMKSRFWRVKPQLHTKLSTKIVDSPKKAFCDDHLKKLLKNYLKNLAEVKRAVSTPASSQFALPTRLTRAPMVRGGMSQALLSDCQRWVA